VVARALSPGAIWRALEAVKDPEIPVVSVVELGVVRSVAVEGGRVTVTITPTFAGCPALHVMQSEIEAAVRRLGAEAVTVRLALSPPWTTDWLSDATRAKLKAFGLAPPPRHNGLIQIMFDERAECPYCGSDQTELKNAFGPTLCRALYYCHACRQPFEQFKPL
jgi:ring-1,2-phenylacetyl-CoA epoxidase subunit PaaD